MSQCSQLPIVVVSGLPRSGTSLMMQMLEAGGIPAFQDAQRQADPDNPRGYYELEPVKKLSQDASVLNDAGGYAVKVIHRFLPFLPMHAHLFYCVIVMRRQIDEVLASQQTMLNRMGKQGGQLKSEQLGRVLSKQLEDAIKHVTQMPNTRVIEIQHRLLFTDPSNTISSLADFLENDTESQSPQGRWPVALDRMAMQQMIEPDLYRQRGK